MVGDKAVLLASEYTRLSEAAMMMQGHVTPSSTRMAQRARAAGRQPLSLQQGRGSGGLDGTGLDPVADSPNSNTSADMRYHEQDVHVSSPGSRRARGACGTDAADADLLNISSDQSSPFSALSSKESPALSNASSLHVSLDGTLTSPAGRVPVSVEGLDLFITLGEIEEGEELSGPQHRESSPPPEAAHSSSTHAPEPPRTISDGTGGRTF